MRAPDTHTHTHVYAYSQGDPNPYALSYMCTHKFVSIHTFCFVFLFRDKCAVCDFLAIVHSRVTTTTTTISTKGVFRKKNNNDINGDPAASE